MIDTLILLYDDVRGRNQDCANNHEYSYIILSLKTDLVIIEIDLVKPHPTKTMLRTENINETKIFIHDMSQPNVREKENDENAHPETDTRFIEIWKQ